MTTWPVWVDGWQQGCCGDHFEVGSQVTWWLGFSPKVLHARLAVSAQFDVDLPSGGSSHSPETVGPDLRVGSVIAQWTSQDAWPVPGPARALRGYFFEDHHGTVVSGLDKTTGTVQSVVMASRRFIVSDRGRVPDESTPWRFRETGTVKNRARDTDDAAGGRWVHDGMVILLDVEDIGDAFA